MPTFNGIELRTSVHLTEDGPPVTVHRSWRERLVPRVVCRFPLLAVEWRPWVASYTFTPKVPRRDALMVGGVLYVHPTTLHALLEKARG